MSILIVTLLPGTLLPADNNAPTAAIQDGAAKSTANEQKKDSDRAVVVIVVGAAGLPEYAEQFTTWADRWAEVAKTAGAKVLRIGDESSQDSASDKQRLRSALTELDPASQEICWVVFIGHGTYDRKRAKFNLRGQDVEAGELRDWIAAWTRPSAIINCASSSAPFINRLSGKNRVIVTSTKSGFEQNYSRFGQYLSSSIGDIKSDLDKDSQVSLLEAFLAASAQVNEYYKEKAQLATEHALIDDNGDALGTPASWFRGVHSTQTPKGGNLVDGLRANQFHLVKSEREKQLSPELRRQRDQLELAIAQLRAKKSTLTEDNYYQQLEVIAIQLAKLYAN